MMMNPIVFAVNNGSMGPLGIFDVGSGEERPLVGFTFQGRDAHRVPDRESTAVTDSIFTSFKADKGV